MCPVRNATHLPACTIEGPPLFGAQSKMGNPREGSALFGSGGVFARSGPYGVATSRRTLAGRTPAANPSGSAQNRGRRRIGGARKAASPERGTPKVPEADD